MDEKGEIKRRIYHLDPYSIQFLIINNIALKFTKNIIKLNVSISIKVNDVSETPHVLCVGLNLENALSKQIASYEDFIDEISKDANNSKGDFKIKKKYADQIYKLSRILNIKWLAEAIENPIDIISINNKVVSQNNNDKISWINDIKIDVMESTK